jgi:large repetitive protein
LRYLNKMQAEANAGGPDQMHIMLRPDSSKAAVLEEFLHGTQNRLGIIDRLGVAGAEQHVADFIQRHKKLLGLE